MQEKLGSTTHPVQYVRWLLGERPIKVLGSPVAGREVPVFDRLESDGRHRRHERRYYSPGFWALALL